MRIIKIEGQNLELTPAIHQFIELKFGQLEKMTARYQPFDLEIRVGKDSKHHAKGEIFFAEVNCILPGPSIHLRVVKDDLYSAIDLVKDRLKNQIAKRKPD